MDKVTKQSIRDIAHRTGLREATVLDLLRTGWMYTMQIDQMSRWQRRYPGQINDRPE